MRLELFDVVALKRDVPEKGLRAGEEGAVVELYEPDGVEVESFRNEKTIAVATLKRSDVTRIAAWRKVSKSDAAR